eukprot:COSAG02_NODE_57259_length_281_cov_0.846154_1_plen_34_part_01
MGHLLIKIIDRNYQDYDVKLSRPRLFYGDARQHL